MRILMAVVPVVVAVVASLPTGAAEKPGRGPFFDAGEKVEIVADVTTASAAARPLDSPALRAGSPGVSELRLEEHGPEPWQKSGEQLARERERDLDRPLAEEDDR